MVLFIFLVVPFVSAIRINEVEMNPPEGKYGNEWIELYNDEDNDVNVSGWEVYDGLVSPRNISTFQENTIMISKEYYIIEISSPKLNNGGDFVTLYNSLGEKIDETKTLKDSLQDDKTHQLCETWEFIESTKGEENNCEIEDDQEPPPENDTGADDYEYDYEDDDEINESTTETTSIPDYGEISNGKKQQPITLNIIKLNPKVIKSENDSENNKDLGDYAIYGFVVFCILLGFLFVLKKYKLKKNETEW